MKRKRVKGYWLKKKESYNVLADARSRADLLRINEHTAHVTVEKDEQLKSLYWVKYSVAKWYVAEMEALGITL